jgi:SAM-dependent methyltransferase
LSLEAERRRVRGKWSGAAAGERYGRARFRLRRRAERDVRALERLLERHAPEARTLLDVPLGAGRLRPAYAGRVALGVGCDVSAPMLRAAGAGAVPGPGHGSDPGPGSDPGHGAGPGPRGRLPRVRGDVWRLPFRSEVFDAVVCCRLLHHLAEPELVEAALAELLRVTRGALVVSYWSAASWPGWRRRRGWSAPDAGGRRERPDADLARWVAAAGGTVRELHRPAGRLSNQAFLVATRA